MPATLDTPRTEDAELRELEELWAVPAVEPRRRALGAVAYPWLRRAVVLGWAAFLVAVIMIAPAPDSAASSALWAEFLLSAWWLGMMAAAVLAWRGEASGALAISALAGATGVALGYACRVTEHHLGSWWLVEAGACAALALLSVAALAARRAT